MRKVKFAFLFVLILCLTAAMFVACNPSSDGGNDVPSIPTPEPGKPGQSQEMQSIGGTDAWNMMVDAAKASNSDTGNLVTLDYIVNFDYVKDAVTYSYAFKVQANIDLENDAGNQSLLELWERDVNGDLVKMLLGVYYFDSTLVYDCTGLKAGATVVKTDNINATAVVKTLRELLTSPGSDEYKSLAQFLLNDILSAESGIVGMIGGAIPALISTSRITTNPDGSQTIVMPIGLSNILGGVLGGILAPSEDGLIPAEVYDMVQSVLGIDLGLLSTMKGLSVYISADLTADNGSGRELSGVNVGVGFDYDTFGTSLEQDYGIQQGSISLNVGGTGLQWNNGLNEEINIESYLTSPKAAEGQPESDGGRGLNLAMLDEYSPLTIDLTVSLDLVLKAMKITPNELISSFGTLITGMLGGVNMTTESLNALLNKEINITEDVARTLQVHISGGIDMFNNDGTNLLVELTGADKYNDVRASIGYVGADESLYVDLSGLLGTGKFYVDGINLNEMLGGLIDDLVAMVQKALVDNGIIAPADEEGGQGDAELTEEQEQMAALIEQAKAVIADGTVVRTVGTTAEGEPILDTIGLVKAILENIDVEMAGNIFNLEKVSVTLTEEILNYIWSLVFVDDEGNPTGGTIPVSGDGVKLTITDNGFGESKDILVELGINVIDLDNAPGGEEVKKLFAKVGVGISARFGSVEDKDYFDGKIAAFSTGRQNNEYIKLASLESLLDKDGNLSLAGLDITEILAGVETLEIGLEADIDISAIEGTLATINYEKTGEFILSVLAEFAESFGTRATLSVKAEVLDVAALVNAITSIANAPEDTATDIGALLGTLLPALNLEVKLSTKDGVSPVQIWLVNGVVYLETSEEILGGIKLKVDIKPFLTASGASEAISADETGSATETPCEHVDNDGNDICDKCGKKMPCAVDDHVDKIGAKDDKNNDIPDGICDVCGSEMPVTIPAELLAIIAAADVNFGDLYLDVALGTGLLGMLLTLADIEGLTITDAAGGELGLEAGVSINFANGLQIAGGDTSEGLSVGVVLGVGDNFDLDLTLGGINAAINGESSIDAPVDDETFIDFINEPYINLGLELGIKADIKPTNIPIGDSGGKITFPEAMGIDVVLSVDGKLDIAPLLASLTGVQPEGENGTELAVKILNNSDGANEVLLAAYYKSGILYVDAGALLGARVSVELDIMQLLVGLINQPAGGEGGGEGGTSAISAAGDGQVPPKEEVSAFELLLKVTSEGFILELAEGLTEIVKDAIGMELGEIEAALSLNWSNLVDKADAATDEYLFSVNVSAGDIGDIGITLSPLAIGLGKAAFVAAPSVVPDQAVLDEFTDLGSLLGADGNLDPAGLEIETVYAELEGTISLGASSSDSEQEWTIGSWVGPLIPVKGEDNNDPESGVDPKIKSLIEKLVVSFVVNKNVGAELNFKLRALLRLDLSLAEDEIAGYILSHSDIALEIYEGENLLIALYIIADEETGRSSLYINSPEGGLIGGGIVVPGIDLGGLFATSGDDGNSGGETPAGGETGEQAITTAEGDVTEGGETTCTEHVDKINNATKEETPDGLCDNCGAKMDDDALGILNGILGILNGIYMTDEQVRVGFGPNFLASLINMLLPTADIDPENFAELNSEKSYLSLFYGKRDGSDQRDIGLDLAITVDPVSIGLSLGGINAAINDANKSVLPEGFEESNYKSILDPDGVISLDATVQLDLELFGTEDLPDGELPVGDILSNFIANLALSTGVVIDDDIAVGIAIDLGANIYLADAEKTEVSLVIRDSNSTAEDGSDVILAAYLRGDKLYVDMGMLSEDNFYVAGTGVVQFLLGKVNELLAGDGESGVGSSEAVTATNGKSTEEEELEALNIILEATQGHLALSVTEAVLLGIVNAVAGGQEVDINEIFEALGLDANVSVDISFEDPVGLTVAADTKYAALSLAVIKPYISNEPNEKVTEAINKAANAGYNQYVAGVSSFARFGITLSVEYGADATYEEVTDPENYDESERYELLPDGTFVQSAEGTYIRNPLTLSDVVGALLSMDAISNALEEMGNNPDQADIAALLKVLLASLGVELYLDDPIGDNLDIRITGLLDLEALGLTDILSTLTMPKLDTQAILNALQVGLELIFNPEDGVDSASVAVYLINGDLYVDLSGLGGPRISVKLFEILDKMGVFNEGGGSEAVTAAGGQCENGHTDLVDADNNQKPDCVCDVCHAPYHVDVTGGEKDENGNDTPDGKCDKCGMPYASDTVNAVLNALVRAVVFRTNLGGVIGGNVFESGLGLDVMLPSNMLGELVALITGAEEGYVFEDFVLNENDSKISLNIGGGNGIELVVSARSNAGFNVSVAAKAGLEIEVATSDSTLLTVGEKRTFIDMTSLATTVIDMINSGKPDYKPVGDGELAFGSQQITLSVSGKAEFESLGDGSYDVGTLLAQWLQDVALNIETDSAFTDGIGFRLTVNADLSKLGFEALFDDSLTDANAKAEAFFEKSDLNSIEAALELLDIDAAGNIVDNVLAGIYLSGGTLYLDGTGIFDVVENYSYVANFLTFVIGAIELGGNNGGGNENNPTEGEEGQGPATQALAAAAAVSAAEGDETVVRDALINLIYSDTAMQIVITKSIISSLLAALVPDLGSIADIFDRFEVSLGVDIGRHDYVDVKSATYTAAEDVNGKYIAIRNNGGDIVGFMLADGSEETKYTLTSATEATGATEDLLLYYQAKDGNFYIANGMRYRLVEEEQFVPAGDLSGAYVKVEVDGSAEYLYRYDYVFYTKAANGGYDVVTDLEKVAAGTTVYVRVAGSYIVVSSDKNGVLTYDREYGYVRDEAGNLLRVYHPYTDLDEFYLSLGAEVGSMRVGLSLGGIGLEFGRTKSIVPAYITAGKTKTPTTFVGGEKNYTYDEATGTYTLVPEAEKVEGEVYYQDFPLMPFYDSVVTVGASVELELAITEGNIDIGQIFSSILGDLEGLVIQIPSTNKGYSSAHLRLDLTLVLDAFDLPSSEIMVELYNLSSESGAEVRWLAANYFNEMLYIDLSFFGLPKLAVPMTEIADMLRDLIGDLLDSSIYQDVEVGGASAEAITADDSASTENDMISTEDKVAALLISKRKLAISIGNAMMRYLLTLLTIGDDPLNMLIYEQLKGGLDVTIDLNKGFDVGIGAELMLEGDRYEFVQVDLETEEERFFVFESVDDPQTAAPDEGLFLYDSATDSYREASRSEINAVKDGTSTDTLFVRYEAEKVGENWVYYTYTESKDGKWFFDEETDSYIEVKAADEEAGTPAVVAPEGAKMYTKSAAIEATNKAVYRFKAGAGANPNDYDTVLTLDVNVGAIDMYFTEEREFTLSKEELEDFYEFNGLDTVSLSETISLGLLFADKEEIDLAAVLEYFFPDSDFTAIIGVDSGREEINNILRDIDITVSLEFKLGAFVNYLRSLAARYDLSYEDEAEDGKKIRVALESLTGDIDLITFINVIRSLIGAKKVPNADGSIYYTDPNVDDLFGLDDILNFVNASVEIATVSNDGVPAHTMLGVYYSLGDNEGTAYKDYEGSVTPARYSHYFASEDGIYGYVGVDADTTDGENDGYMLIDDITGYDEEVHGRYSRDNSFLYPDANGDRVREYAGLYVDLSYFGQPGVFINIGEMLALVGGWMGGELALPFSEAVTAADETTEGSEGTESSFSLPYDLGTLFGGDVNLSDSLPLLSEEIASYITAFVYGARITSTYIRILVESDFLTQILTLLTGGPIFDEDLAFEQSYVGINVDFNNYLYAYLATATTEQIEFSDTRFAIERDDVDGMYWIYTDPLTGEQIMQLRSDMTAAEIADYEAAGEYGYYNITPIETYLHVGDDYILSSEASNTDWVRAERYTDAGDLGNGYLIGTYKFYVKAGTTYAGEDSNGDGYAEFGADAPIFVVYPSENMKPLVEANIWLWGHNLSLDIHTPVTSAAKFSYTEVAEGTGQYVAEERVVYEPADGIVGDGRDYIYYRGSYYPINTDTLLKYENGSYNSVGASGWSAFKGDPFNGSYFVRVHAEDDGIIVYVPVKAADLYTEKVYDTVYRYVGAKGGDYVRNATTSLVTVPEYRVYVDNVINDFDIAAGENEDTTFVYDEETLRGVSVAAAREAFFEAWKATYDTDGDGKVDEALQEEFNQAFAVHLREVYGDEGSSVTYYDGTAIDYGDTGELYYIDVAIRGSISLSQHVAYLTKGEWEEAGFGNVPGDDQAYVLVRGEYVKYDAAKHGGMTKYYAHTASSSAVSEVLGAILGDMDALFTVADGYKAVLPFEIRATVKIAYPSETDDHFYVAGLELAIDLWRTEADDDTLTHILGLYYKSEQLNINDNDDSNDSTESAGLYLDLSWILGPTAKVKVDLSDYTLEQLLSGVLEDLQGNENGEEGGSEAVTAAEGDVSDPDGVTVLLNLYSRKLALQASAGFLKLVIGLLAPDISSTLDEMMPNVSVGVDINAAPYDLTIGATLYDEKGTGLLDLGITLNLFGTSDPSTGLQLGFGAKEDYDEVAAGQLASILAGNPGDGNNDYIYYHALYSRATADEVNNASDDSTFYVTTPGKEYKAIDVATAKGIVDRGGTVYKLDDGTEYIPFSDAKARDESLASGYVRLDERYASIPITTNNGRPSNNSYVQLQSDDDYAWARANGLTVYYLSVTNGSDGTYTTGFRSVTIPAGGKLENVTARNAVEFFNYDGSTDGTGKLYIRVSNAYNKEGFAERFNESTLGVDPLAASATYYLPDGNGTYIKSDVFGNYSTLLSLDLNTLLGSTGNPDATEHEHTYNDEGICTVCGAKKIDFLGLILEGIGKAGVETVEIGASLALDLTFSCLLYTSDAADE